MSRVLESIKAGIRLSESRFSHLKMAPQGQGSVLGLLKHKAADEGLPGCDEEAGEAE